MKILIISTQDNRGGAAKAAYRFTKEFQNQGNEVCLYTRDKRLKDSFIKESPKSRIFSKFLHLLDFAPGYILSGFNKEIPFTLGLFGENFNKVIKEFEPDIINIHWTWKGFISFSQICKVSKEIPVVWTMHDYSPFYDGFFYHYKENILIKSLYKLNSKFRNTFLKDSNITFVSPSKFLLNEFNKSSLFEKFKGVVINNGVDTNIFRIEDKTENKRAFGLNMEKRYILFGAVNLVKDPIKGGKILREILHDMEEYLIENKIGLISFGSQNSFKKLKLDERLETKFLGFIKTDEEMSKILSLSDVVLVPSLYENYPFAVLEPLSCKIPVTAFNVGGTSEIIKHKKNGYLAEIQNKGDFINGVKFCLENKLEFDEDYSVSTKSKEYISLFNDCLKTSLS